MLGIFIVVNITIRTQMVRDFRAWLDEHFLTALITVKSISGHLFLTIGILTLGFLD